MLKQAFKWTCLLIPSCFILISNAASQVNPPVTIYTAKDIITMDPSQPHATAVAVKDGRIFSVGSLDTMKSWMKPGAYQINNDYENDVITPGMIEAHSHIMLLSLFMTHPYVGYYDTPGINGTTLKGAKTRAEVVNILREANKQLKDPDQILFAWQYDPIFLNGEELTAKDLDQISRTRPIFVLNASDHIGYVNSVVLQRAGYNQKTTIKGVVKGKNGKPNGVLQEMAAAGPVLLPYLSQLASPTAFKTGLYGIADLAHRAGLTTISDMLFGGKNDQPVIAMLKSAAKDPAFPVRMVLAYDGPLLYETRGPMQGVFYIQDLAKGNTDKLRFGQVKFITDGSIQGFTARLNWPGYFNGADNGIYNLTTEEMKREMLPFWQANIPIHVHVNGNQATEAALDALDYLQITAPRRNPRYVLEHNQMSTSEQFQRAAKLGAQTNIFANHIYYWGDQHYAITMGPDRANHIDDAAEAIRNGMIFSLHTDAPVTPLGPLHSMWAAVNRTTASGRVLGASERISAEDALRAVTINAAYLLNMEREIGSIEIGKRADFTVLAKDPISESAAAIKDIPVIATIQGGTVYPVNEKQSPAPTANVQAEETSSWSSYFRWFGKTKSRQTG